MWRGLLTASVISSIALAMLVGCVKRQEVERSSLTDAYRLLDLGRNAEAVELLDSLHKASPDDQQTTVALASAYASLAGLQVYSFYDLFYEAMFSKPWAEIAKGKSTSAAVPQFSGLTSPDLTKKNPTDKMNTILQTFVKMLSALVQISNVLAKLPTVAPENRIYLEQALVLLDSVDKIGRSQAVFRALLRSAYLKYVIASDLSPGTSSEIVTYDGSGHCQFSSEKLSRGIVGIGKVVSKLMIDLATGFPKDKASFAQIESSFRNSTVGLSGLFDTMSSIQMRREIDQGLDTIWGCGS